MENNKVVTSIKHLEEIVLRICSLVRTNILKIILICNSSSNNNIIYYLKIKHKIIIIITIIINNINDIHVFYCKYLRKINL